MWSVLEDGRGGESAAQGAAAMLLSAISRSEQ